MRRGASTGPTTTNNKIYVLMKSKNLAFYFRISIFILVIAVYWFHPFYHFDSLWSGCFDRSPNRETNLNKLETEGRNWIPISQTRTQACFNLEKIFKETENATDLEIERWQRLRCVDTLRELYGLWYSGFFLFPLSAFICVQMTQVSCKYAYISGVRGIFPK